MAYTYPPGAMTLTGDVETINRFLNSPTTIGRRLRDLSTNRFIADTILSGRSAVEGGAVVYEQDEGLFTNRAVTGVAPGSEYELTDISSGPAQAVKIVKWGQDTFVTDEAIRRQRMSPVERAMQKLVNSIVKQVDAIALALVASQVTQTIAVGSGGAWSTTTARILEDVMKAKAVVLALNKGYDPDTLVVDDTTYAYVSSNATVLTAARREDAGSPIYTGSFPVIAGLRILPTPNLPAAGAWVLDSTVLGGIADEDLGGNYQKAGNVEAKSIREEPKDQWRLRARRPCVPWVSDPGSAIKITGI